MNSNQTAKRRDDDKPEVAPFRQSNPSDNPIDENGKTKRDLEVEKAQEAARKDQASKDGGRKDANRLEERDRDGQRSNPVAGGDRGGEFSGSGQTGRDAGADLNRLNAASAAVDPRNAGNEASRRPPVPGVDKPLGGSSDGPPGGTMGSAPDAHKYPLPNPNNPDSPNNPSSTAVQDRLAASPTPPLPTGERTTVPTPMDGKSDAQRAAEDKAEAKADAKAEKDAKDDKKHK